MACGIALLASVGVALSATPYPKPGVLAGAFHTNEGVELDLPSDEVTKVGDTIYVHQRIFDASGRLVFSTQMADLPTLESTQAEFDGPFVVPNLLVDEPLQHVLREAGEPLRYGDSAIVPLGDSLLGKTTGHVVALPVIGRVPDYEQEIRLERIRGPFNITMNAQAQTLRVLGASAIGDRVELDGVLVAEVVEWSEPQAKVRILVEDGSVLPVQQAGFKAVVSVDATESQFRFRLDAEVGDEFSLVRGCSFGQILLASGSYRVAAVSDDVITLLYSPMKWPQLIDRDLMMVLELVKIERTEQEE